MTDQEFIDRVQDFAGGSIEQAGESSIEELWSLFGAGVSPGDKQGLVDAMLEDYGGEIPQADLNVLAAAGYPLPAKPAE